MIDEVTKSIKAQLYDRITSPLFSSFLISWSAWNYKLILIVLSASQIKEKLSLIDAAFPDQATTVFRGAVFPLLTALAIIFLYPYPAKYIYKFSRLRQQELKVIQTEIDDSTPMTKDEARKLRREALANTAELEAQVEKHRLETTHLKERMVSLQQEIDEIHKKGTDAAIAAEPSLESQKQHEQQTNSSAETPSNQLLADENPVQSLLTEEAQALLVAGAEDKSGTILHIKFIGGTSIQTNGRNQIPSDEKEIVARWESALRLLVTHGLVHPVGNRDEIFQVTDLGYKTAKLFQLPAPLKSEKEFAADTTSRLRGAVRWDILTDPSSPTFESLLQEYLEKYVPPNIAIKPRHQATIADRLHQAFLQLQSPAQS